VEASVDFWSVSSGGRCGDFTKIRIFKHILTQISAEKRVLRVPPLAPCYATGRDHFTILKHTATNA